jgi:hypothetical protein
MGKGIAAGILGAVLGALGWAIVAHYANVEIGWLAWGIGFLVGWLSMVGSGGRGCASLGVAAAVISLASIGAGKYVGVWLDVREAMSAYAEAAEHMVTEEYLISIESDAVVQEMESAGKTVKWPDGVDPADASSESDYPPAVWKEGRERWLALSDAERDEKTAQKRALMQSFAQTNESTLRNQAFQSSFSAFDILWVVLAVCTAYKLGSGADE